MATPVDGSTFGTCAHCGVRLSGPEWYPATTQGDGESFAVLSFCDEGCLTAWREA